MGPSLIHAIVFSKDRAWQLGQLLRSMRLYAGAGPGSETLVVSVLYTVSPAKKGDDGDAFACTETSYLEVAASEPWAVMVREEPKGFGRQVLEMLDGANGSCPVVQFLVDDLVFFSDVDLGAFARLLLARPQVAQQ